MRVPKQVLGYAWRMLSAVLLMWFSSPMRSYAALQADQDVDACANVRYLMTQEISPYDLDMGGGILQPDIPVSSEMTPGHYADFWAFQITRQTNAEGNIENAPLRISIEALSGGLDLEFQVFQGMTPVPDVNGVSGYQQAILGAEYNYSLSQDGIYTLAVQRTHVSQLDTSGEYQLTASFPGGGDVVIENIRDNSTNQPLPIPPELVNGTERLYLPEAEVAIHSAGAFSVALGTGTQTRFDRAATTGLLVGAWADNIAFLGGNLAVRGTVDDLPRLLYLENFGFATNILDLNLENFNDSNETHVRTDWQFVKGIWLLENCVGFKLRDNRTFVAVVEPTTRSLVAEGSMEEFTIRVNAPDASDVITEHQITLSWDGIAAESELHLANSILDATLPGEHTLQVQSTNVDIRRTLDSTQEPTGNEPYEVTLHDQEATVILDWTNMASFTLANGVISMGFTDAPRQATTRNGENLLHFEALGDVIQIVYKDTPEGQPGEQRLLLPRSESYLEIVTPAGLPMFDGRGLPDQPGYAPRALNNLGNECYPVNTMLAEANCPPNGHPNPANGNLWYSVTDLIAYGHLLDLALSRSYNSAAHGIDGPFGLGWTTGYLLDYNVLFNPLSAARTVDITNDTYRIGLDVTWAPRGIVTFTTPSGSQHVFTSPGGEPFTGGTLSAITMTGWMVQRDSVRDETWQLIQGDGLTYEFDRAGRLLRYGYPQQNRMIEVHYPDGQRFDSLTELNENTPIIITDALQLRRLELYFNDQQHIVRSVLRDLTQESSLAGATCDPALNCYQALYHYTGNLLTEVVYPDGQPATYYYDDQAQRMTQHDDPRAPVARNIIYAYDAQYGSLARADILLIDGQTALWRIVSSPNVNQNNWTVQLTDQYNSTRTYTYRWNEGTLRAASDTFTLISQVGPLADEGEFEAVPTRYTWANGLLTSIEQRLLFPTVGRNSINFGYTSSGQIASIQGGFPGVSISYGPGATLEQGSLPQSVTLADNATLSFTYDESGKLDTFRDRDGATYQHTWDERQWLTSRVRLEDGLAWDYEYNEVGLVTAVTQRRVADSESGAWYRTTYGYDGLGRLTDVSDPLLGDYTISYPMPTTDDDGNPISLIVVTDETGAATVSVFNERGLLVETRLSRNVDDADFLTATTYDYDYLGRLTSETRWLIDEAAGGEWKPHTTYYDYELIAVLPSLPGEDAPATLVNGYAVTMQDPYGRQWIYTHDALERIRQVQNQFDEITRYDYFVTETEGSGTSNGLRIVQRNVRGNSVSEPITYYFDLRWQLRRVEHGDQVWEFLTEGDSTRLRAMRARHVGILELGWEPYNNGHPTGLRLAQAGLGLTSGTELPEVIVGANYDFLGRPIRVSDQLGNVTLFAYCPEAQGQYRVLRSRLFAASQVASLDCDSTDFAQALWYDVHDRLIRVDDAFGSRTFNYHRDDTSQEWVARPIYTSTDGTVTYSWELRYAPTGKLTRWTDEAGFIHFYEHDTLGRLRRVYIEGLPEGSFTFTYNEADLVTEVRDDLGRGFSYAYDQRGQLIVRQDVSTRDAVTYAYGPFGQLSTVISPLGNTTSFVYEDPNDPTRLTSIITPTGSQNSFNWDDERNRLIHTNPGNHQTMYSFDSLGMLWRIEDGLGRSHELHYDGAGNLTDWLQALPAEGGQPAQHLALSAPNDAQVTVMAEMPDVSWNWRFGFNQAGQLATLTNPTGQSLAYGYDPLGRLNYLAAGEHIWTLERVASQAGQFPTVRLLNASGEPLTTLSYDGLYRLRSHQNGGASRQYNYTSGRGGNLVLTVQQANTRTYTFSPGDDLSRPPTVVLSAPGNRISHIYNAEGQLTEITTETCRGTVDPANPDACFRTLQDVWRVSVRFTYDAQGRPSRVIDAEDNIETFAYDDAGNLSTYQNANGKSFNYTYDSLNRLVSISGPTGIKLVLQYDSLDHVSGICRTRADASNDYDQCAEQGDILETYDYDALGRLATQSFPNGEAGNASIQHRYDAQGGGLLTSWGTQGGTEVVLSYSADGRMMLETVATSDESYSFRYDDFAQLTGIGGTSGVEFTLDDFGRVTGLVADGRDLTYTYEQDDKGYTVLDNNAGVQLRYMLDERGFLSSMDYVPEEVSGETPLMSFVYRANRPEDGILSVDAIRDDGSETISLALNGLGETEYIAYVYSDSPVDKNLFVDYLTTPLGQIMRQRFSGADRLFREGSDGYVVVVGYDDDDRPLTMRINAKDDGELLYMLTLTYDELGQRKTEAHAYSDGTQIIITYGYHGALLESRQIEISIPQATMLGAIPVLLIGASLLGLSWYRIRRRIFFYGAGVCVAAASLFVAVPLLQAQQSRGIYVYRYESDVAGNVTQVELESPSQVCAIYTYDNANRLVSVQRNEWQRTYTYDAYNRLSRAGDWTLVYQGNSHTPLMAYNQNGESVYYGQTADSPAYFLGEDGGPSWFVHNGRDEILTKQEANDNPETLQPIWLFDPLGRTLTLEAPALDIDMALLTPCQIATPPAGLERVTNPQLAFGDMMWDAQANLYFDQGRAYDPEIGQFLQRDPRGPDVFGNVYGFPPRQAAPPMRRRDPAFMEGLQILGTALETGQVTEMLTAEAIARQYAPTPVGFSAEPLFEMLNQPPARVRNEVTNLLDLPSWLAHNYNLAGPQLDFSTGTLWLPRDNAPGNGSGLSTRHPQLDISLWQSDIWLPDAPQGQAAELQHIVEWTRPPVYQVRNYMPFAWRPLLPRLESAWGVPSSWINSHVPGEVWERLPRPLIAPASNVSTLNLIQALQGLPFSRGQDWIAQSLQRVLPMEPTLPAQDREVWARSWFTDDLLGVADALQMRWNAPPTPTIPVYRIGSNVDWLLQADFGD